jgi:hypothetical protein
LNRRIWLISAIILLAFSSVASADAGVPMLYLIWPGSWVLFVPIVVVEAIVARRLLDLAVGRSLALSAVANAASTLVGIPATWGALLLVEILATSGGEAYGLDTVPRKILAFTVQAPWLIPYESDLGWLIPSAAIFLCIPFFFASVLIERFMARRMAPTCPPGAVSRWSWRANLLSYSLILTLLFVLLAEALLSHTAL